MIYHYFRRERLFAEASPLLWLLTKATCVRLPVNILAVCRHLPQLLLSHILHDHHGADPEHISEAKVDDAVGRLVIAT